MDLTTEFDQFDEFDQIGSWVAELRESDSLVLAKRFSLEFDSESTPKFR